MNASSPQKDALSTTECLACDSKGLPRFDNAQVLQTIRSALLAWFRAGHRELPWRKERDPYAIWISEVMLQQTRVETVKEYFSRFMQRFPSITLLADAPLDDVLALWSGLGYYSRARNLHRAAQLICTLHGGTFPSDPSAIAALPGIGPYTAGAIRSIAFGQAAPVLDGNVVRVISRWFLIDERPDTATGKRVLWSIAERLVASQRTTDIQTDARANGENFGKNDSGDLNQSLMELGATVCLPRRPVCLVCPVTTHCQAHREGRIHEFPRPKNQSPVPHVRNVTLLVCEQNRVLLLRRPEVGLWGGLWEPPTVSLLDQETETEALLRLSQTHFGVRLRPMDAEPLSPFSHLLTHRKMFFSPYVWRPAAQQQVCLPPYTAQRFVELQKPLALGLSAWVAALLATWSTSDP